MTTFWRILAQRLTVLAVIAYRHFLNWVFEQCPDLDLLRRHLVRTKVCEQQLRIRSVSALSAYSCLECANDCYDFWFFILIH